MAQEAQVSGHAWLAAYCDHLQKDLKRLEEENTYLKGLLWKSSNSWAEKEKGVEMDLIGPLDDAGLVEALKVDATT